MICFYNFKNYLYSNNHTFCHEKENLMNRMYVCSSSIHPTEYSSSIQQDPTLMPITVIEYLLHNCT
jgi:hypothetical protein